MRILAPLLILSVVAGSYCTCTGSVGLPCLQSLGSFDVLDGISAGRQSLVLEERSPSEALLPPRAPLRLNGGSSNQYDIAFSGVPARPSLRDPARYSGPKMKGESQAKKFVIFKGRFADSLFPKAISSMFGISLFSGPIKPSFAAHGNHFPLIMADGNNAAVTKRRDGRKRVLLLLSDTGGGHKASAKAIQAALDELYPGKFLCEITDIWTDYGSWPFNTFVESYQWAAKNMWAWRMLYYYGLFPPAQFLTQRGADMRCFANFKAYMQSFDPDIVVSVHPLCQTLPLRVLKHLGGGKRKVPFVTVVTDLGGAHSTWFHRDVDRCCVPGDAVERIAYKNGLTKQQVRKHGLPVRQGFWGASHRRAQFKQVRQALRLEDVPTVLVVGGGDGVGGLQKVAMNVGTKMGKFGGRCQMIVVCGKNEQVQKALKTSKWPANVNVVVQGFVSNMDDWMVASDCLVTKAGPGTIAEASILGLPTMLSAFLPGQEAGNVPYVIDAGFGDFEADASKLADKVTTWLADKEKLQKMSVAASHVGKKHSLATKEIAKDIAELVLNKPAFA